MLIFITSFALLHGSDMARCHDNLIGGFPSFFHLEFVLFFFLMLKLKVASAEADKS